MFDVSNFGLNLSALADKLDATNDLSAEGKVTQVVGLVVEGYVPGASVGSMCSIALPGNKSIMAEVVGFREGTALMMPLGDIGGIQMGTTIKRLKTAATVPAADFSGTVHPLEEPQWMGSRVHCRVR